MEKNELMDMQHGYVMDMFTDRVNKRSQTMKYISHDSISTKSIKTSKIKNAFRSQDCGYL